MGASSSSGGYWPEYQDEKLSMQSPAPVQFFNQPVMTTADFLTSPRRVRTPGLTPRSATTVLSPQKRLQGRRHSDHDDYEELFDATDGCLSPDPAFGGGAKLMTTNQALFSVLNVFVGLGLLSKPVGSKSVSRRQSNCQDCFSKKMRKHESLPGH